MTANMDMMRYYIYILAPWLCSRTMIEGFMHWLYSAYDVTQTYTNQVSSPDGQAVIVSDKIRRLTNAAHIR